MMQALVDLIAAMPEPMKPLAQIYAAVLDRVGKELVAEFVKEGIAGNWRDAYSLMVLKMTTTEAVSQIEMTNDAIAQMNNENAKFLEAQRSAFIDLLVAALAAL